MCGICGIYRRGGAGPEEADTLRDMLGTIRHRGPDDEGTWGEGDLAMGMRRLSIIDLDGGRQPMFSEDGRVAVVFNGEIYNYRELAEQLRRRGHVFATSSDTEVIVHLYEERGAGCVDELRGMFAFAVWDGRRRQLFLARDRLGIKPLYYTQAGGRLGFASEVKALLRVPGVEARLDPEGLSLYLSLRYTPAPKTMFAGIHSLPPGHILTCGENGVAVRPYWDLAFDNHPDRARPEEAYAEQLEEILLESVRLHLASDVPFGAFLSGGVDSSLVVALMSHFLGEPVKTFSVGFEGDGQVTDERPYARLIARRYGTDHHEVCVRPRDLIDLAEEVTWHLDQPIADQATLAVYQVSRLAASHVKMVLTGEGGDELFAGYARYAGERMSPLFRRIPAPVRSLALAVGDRILDRRAMLALYALNQGDEGRRLANWFPLFNPDAKAALLSSDLRQTLNGNGSALRCVSAARLFAEHLGRTNATASLNRMLYVDTKLWLPDYLLLRGDKLSMAASLEARVPLLDHKLVEFAASLPPGLKLKGMMRKYLLKKVGLKWLPKQIVHRKKEGFPIPVFGWLRREARDFVRDHLSPDAVRRRGLFNPACVERLLDEHESGAADRGLLLWGLVGVELWHRAFIDPRREGVSSPLAAA